MRISLAILFCLLIVVVNSATTRRTTKAPAKQSVYAYLRSIRGTKSCASGTCPFWERHGRSFVSLQCYQQQYQECVCLHRMCFSSCMFSRDTCNSEMVKCLQQICQRCTPGSAAALVPVYNALANQIAVALSTFACYPCCASVANSPLNSNGKFIE